MVMHRHLPNSWSCRQNNTVFPNGSSKCGKNDKGTTGRAKGIRSSKGIRAGYTAHKRGWIWRGDLYVRTMKFEMDAMMI